MSSNRFLRATSPAVVVLALVLAACGQATTNPTTIVEADHSSDFWFGEPADPDEADRTVDITADDTFRFSPTDLTVAAGETITFTVTNAGQLPHEFTLGDAAIQDDHEAEMTEMGGMSMPDEPNSIGVAAGETKQLTFRFTQAGEVLIGCHVPGHYAAGMKGLITVEA
jgi:uncharacterized cupredoxin-like copper-binding protein